MDWLGPQDSQCTISQVTKNLPATLDSAGVKHNAKIVLLMVDDADPSQHLLFRLKFMVSKLEKGLVCPGGSWNTVDGADPYDDSVMRNTATYVSSACHTWMDWWISSSFRKAEGSRRC